MRRTPCSLLPPYSLPTPSLLPPYPFPTPSLLPPYPQDGPDPQDGPEDDVDDDSEEEEAKAYRSQSSAYASLVPKNLYNTTCCVDACIVNDDLTDGPVQWHTVEGLCVAHPNLTLPSPTLSLPPAYPHPP